MKNKKKDKVDRAYYILLKLFVINSEFRNRISKIDEKWNLQPQNRLTVEEFIKTCGDEKFRDFINDVRGLTKDFNLGSEFIISLIHFLITGEKMLPKLLLNIKPLKEEGVIRLEINLYTTLKDIKKMWPSIEKIKEELWPNIKVPRITLKTLNNLNIYIKTEEERYKRRLENNPEKKYRDLDVVGCVWDDVGDISESADKRRINSIRQIRRRLLKKTK